MGVLWDRCKDLLGSFWVVLRPFRWGYGAFSFRVFRVLESFRWGYGAFSSMLIGRRVCGFVSLATVLQWFVEVALYIESV